MKSPSIPKPEKPKVPIKPDVEKARDNNPLIPRGLASFVQAGSRTPSALGIKSGGRRKKSLLG